MSAAGTWLWFDEFVPGTRTEFGPYTFTQHKIVRFAQRFDPQPFHLDEEAGKQSVFGALCASGWHTGAAYMAVCARYNFVRRARAEAAGKTLPQLGPSPGFENLKWLNPVYAGDTVTFFSQVTAKRELGSNPQWGLVFAFNEGINQSGERVFSFDGKLLVERR